MGNSLSLRNQRAEGAPQGDEAGAPGLQLQSVSIWLWPNSVSPNTLAQGLAWEDETGSVSFWGDCQVQNSPRLGWGSWFGGVSTTAPKPAALCLKPQNFESDPEYTLNAPPHCAEVMKTEGRVALPHLLGVTSSGTAACPLLKCQVSMGKEGPTELSRASPARANAPSCLGRHLLTFIF